MSNPVLRYENVKRAVLKANIEHSDVALRALDRIDHDEDFRDAIIAVLDVEDPKAVTNVIYAQIPPAHIHRHPMVKNTPIATRFKLTIDAQEVVKLINDRALETCIELLSDTRIEKRITQTIDRHFEAMVLAIMGFKNGTFNQLEDTSLVFRKMMTEIHDKVTPIFQAHMAEVDFTKMAQKVVHGYRDNTKVTLSDRNREFYERRVQDLFEKMSRKRVEEIARVDALKLIEDHFGPDEIARGIEPGNSA